MAVKEVTPFYDFSIAELEALVAYEDRLFVEADSRGWAEERDKHWLKRQLISAEVRRRRAGGLVVRPAVLQRGLFPNLRRV